MNGARPFSTKYTTAATTAKATTTQTSHFNSEAMVPTAVLNSSTVDGDCEPESDEV